MSVKIVLFSTGGGRIITRSFDMRGGGAHH